MRLTWLLRESDPHQKEEKEDWMTALLLLAATLALLFLPMGSGNFFGSEGDWLSQHVAIGESLRQTMLAKHSILPQWIGLGGGGSIYDFAYYGLLRPEVLFSCLVPGIPMKYIIAGYAALEVIAGGQLTRIWLRRGGRRPWISFAGALLMVSSTCFYQAHHQIMFVNYMPFLILALMGVDRLAEKGKAGLLTVSLVLVIVHSFYYSPAAICAVTVYGHHVAGEKVTKRSFPAWLRKYVIAIGLAIGMTAVLLTPTAMAILSTSKDGGNSAGQQLELVDLSLEGLLYSPYGCGMTLLALYCLLLALRRRENRFLSAVLLIAMAVPAVSLVLNGFLYARAKILIPFLPLLALVCTDELAKLWERPGKRVWIWLLPCALPAFFSDWKPLAVIEGGILLFWILWWEKSRAKSEEKESAESGRAKSGGFWLILLVPFCVSMGVNLSDGAFHDICAQLGIPVRESYLSADDERQERIPPEVVAEVVKGKDYRFEILADSFMNANVLSGGDVQRTSIYSSISNDAYGTFFYDVMGNAISFNNRVALVAGKNPVFLNFMGVRYVLAKQGSVPYGYEVRKAYGDYVLAENETVRPICYGIGETGNLLNRKIFDKLSFCDKIEALSTRTIVEEGGADTFAGHSAEWEPERFFAGEELEQLYTGGTQEKKFKLNPKEDISGKIIILRFHVERSGGDEVVISIGGVKNKLSSKSAPYPNRNQTFTYVLDGDGLGELPVSMSEGNYKITELSIYTLDKEFLAQPKLTKVQGLLETSEKSAGSEVPKVPETGEAPDLVYKGSITMEEDGYFVTSYPYRNGYQVLVDGEEVGPETINTTFLGFELAAGTHEIEIHFCAPGYWIGWWVSLISGAAFLLFCYVDVREGIGRKKA